MTPDYHTRFKEDFNVADLGAAEFDVEEILAFIDEVVAEERGHEFFAGYDKGKIAGAVLERTALIKVVKPLLTDAYMLSTKSTLMEHGGWTVGDRRKEEYADSLADKALDAVLAHLRTGEEEVTDEELDAALAHVEETEKGGSSFSGRVNFGKPRLSNPVRPWPKETPPQPQDSIREETTKTPNPAYEMYQAYLKDTAQEEDGIREGCCEMCGKTMQDFAGEIPLGGPYKTCTNKDCPCHSPREEGPTKV